jgi:hypothetical protein
MADSTEADGRQPSSGIVAPDLLSCEVQGFGLLWLKYADGVEGRVDMLNVLELGAFALLRNPERFAAVRRESHALVWPCGVRMDADILYADLRARGCAPRLRPIDADPDFFRFMVQALQLYADGHVARQIAGKRPRRRRGA